MKVALFPNSAMDLVLRFKGAYIDVIKQRLEVQALFNHIYIMRRTGFSIRDVIKKENTCSLKAYVKSLRYKLDKKEEVLICMNLRWLFIIKNGKVSWLKFQRWTVIQALRKSLIIYLLIKRRMIYKKQELLFLNNIKKCLLNG